MRRIALIILAVTGLACDDTSAPVTPPPPPPPPPPADGITLVAEVSVPPRYGIHDTFVRDGIAFVLAWDAGLIMYDVGHGAYGGAPERPAEISRIAPSWGQAHNGWWFHNPTTGEKRYFFVGEEDPRQLGSSAGDIHVIDVSDLRTPRDVAFFHLPNAGTHNFWMDEQAQILYAAYYDAGVVALDVSGTLEGDLSGRLLRARRIGGDANTYTWGVQLANGSLFASDMFSGFWRLDPATLEPLGGGNNVPERYSSDLWVHGPYAYTGTWYFREGPGSVAVPGNGIKVWNVAGPAPVLVDSVTLDVVTISDVQVSDDGRLLVASTEGGRQGLYVFDLTDPRRPRPVAHYGVSSGLHTVTLATINGRLYAFGARNPSNPALLIFDLTELLPMRTAGG